MSNEQQDDAKDLELIHPEIVDESEPWPPEGANARPGWPFGPSPFGPQGPVMWAPPDWPAQAVAEPEPKRPNWPLHILLFVATCASTLSIYWFQGYRGPFTSMLWLGFCYAGPVMTILLCHEMGHYLQSRRYGVEASPPYFIPMPFSPFGTMGAVIVMGSRIKSRRALFDIGISGPLAGLVPTMIFLIWGLFSSKYVPIVRGEGTLGEPLLFKMLAAIFCPPKPYGMDLQLSPMAFAGWVGLLVTSLNLIPIGQLDGGHVLYALIRRRAHKVATFLLAAAFFITILDWERYVGWTLMLVLLLLMGPRHPPTADDYEPLGWFRIILGWLTLAFIIIGFTATPLGNGY